VDFLVGQAQPKETVVVLNDGIESRKSSILEETALRMGPQPLGHRDVKGL